ncbi:hypothetical protein [Leptolyngbya sp. GGD]|uniref:hypothetical protein n=1 Tax=Leptolyngbya sp. GGD TaxID=2997907 RepID=UPI00227A9B3C|nr:hypothetical protein [Leptolyngbya sp. GGD]MCY6493177.1 hypothetical protein [Leptolyngbya sp. GGD]
MNSVERQKLLEAVNTLPDESLLELATFIDYLQYKVDQPKPKSGSDFLISIAGLGASDVDHTEAESEKI